MKLEDNLVKTILDTTNLACILGVEGLIVDNEAIRGFNDNEGVMVLVKGPFDFDFKNLGLSRLASLKQKFKLLNESTVTVEAIPRKSNEDIIEKLQFDCGKINFEFRCALAKSIKDVPSLKINKTPLFSFNITENDFHMMTKSASAMRSKNMTIQNSDDGVRMRFSDDTGDILNCEVSTNLQNNSDSENMSLTVNLKKMLPIFKLAVHNGDFTINILKNNIVYLKIGEIEVFVMPEV